MVPRWFALAVLALAACGGTVIEDTTRSSGGTSGSAAGAPGASQPGSSGSGSTGSESDVSCSEPPDCNWCEGKARLDENGCTVGYTCPNGADACSTEPCAAPEECGASLICLPDGLCWEGPSTCGAKTCEGGVGCPCYWKCDDDRVYRSECEALADGSVMCKCRVDGQVYSWMCVVEEGGGDACGMGFVCCGFPEPFL